MKIDATAIAKALGLPPKSDEKTILEAVKKALAETAKTGKNKAEIETIAATIFDAVKSAKVLFLTEDGQAFATENDAINHKRDKRLTGEVTEIKKA